MDETVHSKLEGEGTVMTPTTGTIYRFKRGRVAAARMALAGRASYRLARKRNGLARRLLLWPLGAALLASTALGPWPVQMERKEVLDACY